MANQTTTETTSSKKTAKKTTAKPLTATQLDVLLGIVADYDFPARGTRLAVLKRLHDLGLVTELRSVPVDRDSTYRHVPKVKATLTREGLDAVAEMAGTNPVWSAHIEARLAERAERDAKTGYAEFAEVPARVVYATKGLSEGDLKDLAGTWKWSGAMRLGSAIGTAIPEIPAVGSKVKARGDLGLATVVGYFVEHEWFGVLVVLDAPPAWYVRQNGSKARGHLFGAEIEVAS